MDGKQVLINSNQGKAQVKIISGNGEYRILKAGNPRIIRTEIYGNVVTVTARRPGETFFPVTDAKGQVSQQIQVKVAPDKRYAMNVGRDYAVWCHFGEMSSEGAEQIKKETNGFKIKQMTWELVARVDRPTGCRHSWGKKAISFCVAVTGITTADTRWNW